MKQQLDAIMPRWYSPERWLCMCKDLCVLLALHVLPSHETHQFCMNKVMRLLELCATG